MQVEQLPCDKENLSTVIGEKEDRYMRDYCDHTGSSELKV